MLSTKKRNGILIAKITGELDHHSAGHIRETIDRFIMEGNVRSVLFDFSSLSMMDSSGIGMVIGRYRLIQGVGGKVSIFAKSKSVLKILRMSGVEKIALVAEEYDKAEEYLA